jgi:hypothetical protein
VKQVDEEFAGRVLVLFGHLLATRVMATASVIDQALVGDPTGASVSDGEIEAALENMLPELWPTGGEHGEE